METAENINAKPDNIDLIDLIKTPNELIYKVLRYEIPLYVKNQEIYRRITLRVYIRILDEEEGLKRNILQSTQKKN